MTITVNGHPLVPVIDPDLLYPIETSACSWGVEGAGAKRVIAIYLEKRDNAEKWCALVDDAQGRKTKEITSIVEGISCPMQQWAP